MDNNNNIFIKVGIALSGISVIMGSFAAHFLKEFIDPINLATFDTGTKYMFYHALAILIISLSHRKFNQNIVNITVLLFVVGIAFFSGSLYLVATREIWGDDSYKMIGAITPIGGAMFIAGWMLLLVRGLKPEDENSLKKGKRKFKKSSRERNDANDSFVETK